MIRLKQHQIRQWSDMLKGNPSPVHLEMSKGVPLDPRTEHFFKIRGYTKPSVEIGESFNTWVFIHEIKVDKKIIVENEQPNLSLKIYFDEIKNCTEIELHAWQPLSPEEIEAVKNFLKKKKEDYVPTAEYMAATYPQDEAYVWVDEAGTIDTATYAALKAEHDIQSKGRVLRPGIQIDSKEAAAKLKPFNFHESYGNEGPLSSITYGLDPVNANKWREHLEKNFNREPVFSETSNDGVNWTPADTGKKIIKPKPPIVHISQTHISLEDLLAKFLDGKPAGNITPLILEFAQTVRRLTIDETVSYMHAEPDPPHTTAGEWTAQAFLTKRPDLNYVKKEL